MESKVEQLKSCHCGHSEPVEVVGLRGDKGFGVRCGKVGCGWRAVGYPTREQARTAWNTRFEASLPGGWKPLSQDYAEVELKACLDAMLVARDDKCLIDEMRKRGLWVYRLTAPPAPTDASRSGGQPVGGGEG